MTSVETFANTASNNKTKRMEVLTRIGVSLADFYLSVKQDKKNFKHAIIGLNIGGLDLLK